MYMTWRIFKHKYFSAALRVIMNEVLSAELNTVFNLPVIATPMRIRKAMSEQLHREITGK